MSIPTHEVIEAATNTYRDEMQRQHGDGAMHWQSHVAYQFAQEVRREMVKEALTAMATAKDEGTLREGESLHDWLFDHCDNAFIYSLTAQVFCLGCTAQELDAYKDANGENAPLVDAETLGFYALRELVQDTEEYRAMEKFCSEGEAA